MSAQQLRELVENRAEVVPLSVDQYHRMIETGIIEEGDPIELLDGYMVRKDRSKLGESPMIVGHQHAWVVRQLTRLTAEIQKYGTDLQIQLPVTVAPDSEPEPDAAIVIGPPDRYRDRHPGPDDVTCVIEVADSPLQRDRTTKLRIYADAGIGQYIIVNLIEGIIEEYREPARGTGRYGACRRIARNESLQFACGEGHSLEIPAGSLLP